jgi:hypothetical protein
MAASHANDVLCIALLALASIPMAFEAPVDPPVGLVAPSIVKGTNPDIRTVSLFHGEYGIQEHVLLFGAAHIVTALQNSSGESYIYFFILQFV